MVETISDQATRIWVLSYKTAAGIQGFIDFAEQSGRFLGFSRKDLGHPAGGVVGVGRRVNQFGNY
jgi:hypothetical protein